MTFCKRICDRLPSPRPARRTAHTTTELKARRTGRKIDGRPEKDVEDAACIWIQRQNIDKVSRKVAKVLDGAGLRMWKEERLEKKMGTSGRWMLGRRSLFPRVEDRTESLPTPLSYFLWICIQSSGAIRKPLIPYVLYCFCIGRQACSAAPFSARRRGTQWTRAETGRKRVRMSPLYLRRPARVLLLADSFI